MSAPSRSQVRVRYAETDQMGITYHGVYFVWFEVGRVEYIRERGVTARELTRRDPVRGPPDPSVDHLDLGSPPQGLGERFRDRVGGDLTIARVEEQRAVELHADV